MDDDYLRLIPWNTVRHRYVRMIVPGRAHYGPHADGVQASCLESGSIAGGIRDADRLRVRHGLAGLRDRELARNERVVERNGIRVVVVDVQTRNGRIRYDRI